VLYTVHFTAFCLGGRFFPDTVYVCTYVIYLYVTNVHTGCSIKNIRFIDLAEPRLQERDQGRGRAAPAHPGRVGWSWSACDQQCSQGMAHEIASLRCI